MSSSASDRSWKNSWMMAQKKQVSGGVSSTSHTDNGGSKMDFKSIMKDIEFLGSTHMTWKEKKELENKKVVSLGGKPAKRQRLPLSVARVSMKRQKEREEKMLQENLILGRFSSNRGRDAKKTERRSSEDRVLKSTEGHFRNGVLDVKHLLRPSAPRVDDSRPVADKKKKKKKGGKKTRGKRNGGRKHR
ncbi:uncharacterized protein [Coffea arabica]|uniref:Uncharacterized protein isoform X2 n=1 Tax=Coffea arabica TaxID=13443 RepID=A0ABM4W5K0_COFAR